MAAELLIVDDESDVREFAANFFGKRKINAITASNGEDAIKLTASEQPKVVLLDIKMEGMDGIETLKKIRELDKTVKVIMVTGRNDEGTVQESKDFGAYGYIHKPLELDELEKVVLKVLKK